MFSNSIRQSTALGLLPALVALSLTACQKPAADRPAAAPAAEPDARLLGLYERACANCHDAPSSGAPQRGDAAAWASRAAAGAPALMASVRQGKGTMPPMGWCPECTDEDLARLVSYLIAAAKP